MDDFYKDAGLITQASDTHPNQSPHPNWGSGSAPPDQTWKKSGGGDEPATNLWLFTANGLSNPPQNKHLHTRQARITGLQARAADGISEQFLRLLSPRTADASPGTLPGVRRPPRSLLAAAAPHPRTGPGQAPHAGRTSPPPQQRPASSSCSTALSSSHAPSPAWENLPSWEHQIVSLPPAKRRDGRWAAYVPTHPPLARHCSETTPPRLTPVP